MNEELKQVREKIALQIEQMGMNGYGTLAIAAAVRSMDLNAEAVRLNTNWLPEHKCGLHLSHNEHRDFYETVEEFYKADDFVSPEEWHKSVAEDSVWVLHWYPNTPIGFNRIAASTLEAIEAALKEKSYDM